MICPCKNCVSKGCGEAHDACEKYKAWKHARALAAARRDAEIDVTGAVIAGLLRSRGKGK